MDFIKKIPASLWCFTLVPIISFLLIMSSLMPFSFPDDGLFGVAIELTENYKWQLFGAAVWFITSAAWCTLVGMFIAEYRNNLIK